MIPETPGTTIEKAFLESPEFKNAAEVETEAKMILKYATTS